MSGQLLPPALLDALAARGEAFRDVAPRADDLWIHATAVAEGIRVAQASEESANYPFIPGSQASSLQATNVWDGGNDRQAAATYRPSELERIVADARRSDDRD